MRHLAAAGDIAGSADLIAADWVNEFNGGGLSTVSGWLDLLPDQTVPQDPRLSVARAWIALNVGRFDDAHMWIEALEAGSAADTVDQGSLGAQLVALREVHAFKTGDLAAALEAARRAITLDFDDAPQARSAACCIYGSALYFSGSIDEAQGALRRAVSLAEKIGDRRRGIYALGYLALIAAESGQLADAEDLIRRATGAAETWPTASTSLMRSSRSRRPPSLICAAMRRGPPTRLSWPSGWPARAPESSKSPKR